MGAVAFRLGVGPGWGLLPLLIVGPAIAAALGGVAYTLAAGAVTLAACALFDVRIMEQRGNHHQVIVAFAGAAGVTAFAMLAAWLRERRTRELEQVTIVAEAAQQVLLRPVPRQVGPVKLAVRYLSASHGARVGGDLYEVAVTPDHVRLIVGDVEGKGLPAVRTAAVVTGAFREAAYEEASLSAIVARIEASLARELGEEEFVTAVLAEVSRQDDKIELISCGHPVPLLLGAGQPKPFGPEVSALPLGLGHLSAAPRIPVTLAFEPGEEVLFYTDGASEARNKAGTFFPLAGCASVRAGHDPDRLVDRLSDEITRYVGHAPEDDIALLLVYKDQDLRIPAVAASPFGPGTAE
ncbi:MAG TPA: PP2C family protein-serine/threonine phosphatase [Streptosporangiaceae bacterium]|nr:PP2C family protein-serine/threonine phosphatase [Streptosporangiaceae bacterium]